MNASRHLRILVITQDDPFYIPEFFRRFVRNLPGNIEVVGVVIQAPLGKKSLWALAKKMWDFYGPVGFVRTGIRFGLAKSLNFLAVSVFRAHLPGTVSLKHLLLRKRWPILHARSVNAPDFLERVRAMNLDLLVSVAASQKFGPALLEIPRYGCINIHNARLPKNRGMLPNFWALFHHDTDPISAITVHRMNEALDDGPIVLQEEFKLDPAESLHRLIKRTKRLGADTMTRAILMFCGGIPPLLPNDASQATYNTFPGKDDVNRFRAKGLKLL